MYQQITLVGNVGSDPDTRYTSSGDMVASFSLAVNRTWTNKSGQKQEKTVWFRVTAWRKLGEIAAQFVTKGRQVLVVGEVEEARPWTDRNGEARASLEVTATTIRLLSGGERGAGPGSMDEAEEIPF